MEEDMAATVRAAIRELLEQTMTTVDTLLEASDRELPMASSHACAQGKDVWTLLTNDIDHEKIHTGQVLEGRYESRITASPMERLVAEWLVERDGRGPDGRGVQRRDGARPVDLPGRGQARAHARTKHARDHRQGSGGPGLTQGACPARGLVVTGRFLGRRRSRERDGGTATP